jgi:hypothetical protein
VHPTATDSPSPTSTIEEVRELGWTLNTIVHPDAAPLINMGKIENINWENMPRIKWEDGTDMPFGDVTELFTNPPYLTSEVRYFSGALVDVVEYDGLDYLVFVVPYNPEKPELGGVVVMTAERENDKGHQAYVTFVGEDGVKADDHPINLPNSDDFVDSRLFDELGKSLGEPIQVILEYKVGGSGNVGKAFRLLVNSIKNGVPIEEILSELMDSGKFGQALRGIYLPGELEEQIKP